MTEPIYINLRGMLDDHLLQLSKLPPARVLSYLAGADWAFVESLKNGDMQLWAKYDEAGYITASVRVPMVREYVNYDDAVLQVFRTVIVVDEWPMSVSLGLPAELREAAS